jgi:hypothetical protein
MREVEEKGDRPDERRGSSERLKRVGIEGPNTSTSRMPER